MSTNQDRVSNGIVVFSPETATVAKTRGIFFFIVFCLIILSQAFYWLFANSAEPIILGMPFGMFVIVCLIAIEFLTLLILFFLEARDSLNSGGA